MSNYISVVKLVMMTLFLVLVTGFSYAQNSVVVSGVVRDEDGNTMAGVSVSTRNSSLSTFTDDNGRFSLKLSSGKRVVLVLTSVGFKTIEKPFEAAPGQNTKISIVMVSQSDVMSSVEVHQKSTLNSALNKGLSVASVDAKLYRNRTTEVNRLLDAVPGIRVRETGGLGSEFNYTMQGLSGKAVRFFVDGVPMESFGAGFAINNYPVNALDRIDVYKGVTPIELGSDALGGAINLVTRKDMGNYIDVNYGYGSFNSHRAGINARYRAAKSGFTVLATAALNSTENNYKVWGATVEIADQYGRPVPGTPRFRRFNDDFNSLAGKLELGFTNVKWADQFMIGFAASDIEKGIQTGRTMAFVYGDVRYKENFLMPNIRWSKRNIVPGLSISLFGAINQLEGTTTDTGSNKYNWAQTVIATPVSGELNGIRAQKSIYTFTDRNLLSVLNLSYKIGTNQNISLSHNFKSTERKGSDALGVAEWTIPYREPQNISKHISALSYDLSLLKGRWTNMVFVKNFHYQASANTYNYNGSQQKEIISWKTSSNSWGAGVGSSYRLKDQSALRFSAERTTRMPDAVELLGDGNTIMNAPNLRPEKSTNLNLAYKKSFPFRNFSLTADAGIFYRNTTDLIWLGEGDLYGTARYENVDRIRSSGAELSLFFTNRRWLEINAGFTYQDVRNRLRYLSNGATNIIFNDRMKNMPSIMANAEARIILPELVRKSETLTLFINTNYVEQFFLSWPSLGQRSAKKTIPEQFVQGAGFSYSFAENKASLGFECRNILNKQVFDNYLLQKPGRSFWLTARYFLKAKQ